MENKKIMIVDDNKEFLDELGEVLSLSGYEIIPVFDSNKALETAIQVNPDLVVLDLMMPGKSGFVLADEITHTDSLLNVPIIAMSAYLQDQYCSVFNLCGIKRYLKKPFQPLNLISKIEEMLLETK